MTNTIGFIGLGMMGHGIAKNLLAKGHALRFQAHRNRSNLEDLLSAGAVEVASRSELVRGADCVMVCVTGTPQVEEIVYGEGGLLSSAREGLIIVDHSKRVDRLGQKSALPVEVTQFALPDEHLVVRVIQQIVFERSLRELGGLRSGHREL